ncbi:hypothetical protein L7F22_040139 [Adiantum nelumboides]|nr:hypothetical protein [Adiantum nelumboides]
MEGTGDSHSELMHRANTYFENASRSSSASSPSSSSIAVAAASVPREDALSPFFSQPHQAAFKSQSHNQALPLHQGQHSSYSSLIQQPPLIQDASYHQARSFMESNTHCRSVSQPSSFFQSLWQSPSFHHGSSLPHYEGILSVKSNNEAICAAASPSSEPSYRVASPSEVSMSEQETSPGPSISGHSMPPLPPLSPSPNAYQLASKKHGTDLNQAPLGQIKQKGHRRSHSEVPFRVSTGKECLLSGPLFFGQSEDDVPLHKLNRSNSTSFTKELHKVPGRMAMEVVGEREGEAVDDLFSMYIDVDKVENCKDSAVDGQGRADNSKPLKKRGIAGAPVVTDNVKTLLPSQERAKIMQEGSESDKEESEKEEDSFMGDSHERIVEEGSQKGGTVEGGVGYTRHQRSASMDNLTYSITRGDDAQHSSGGSHSRQARHHHSLSIDGSLNTKLNFLNGELDGLDMKKLMADDKLAEVALMDPKRAKRILANRQSAARSKERKVRYISELERKVQTLQTEATTLSAQLTLMQRDSTGLTNENNELKLRLQSMEQQAQLHEALHEALRGEVQRLKIATGQIPGQALNQFFQMAQQSSSLASQQVNQQHPQAHVQQHSQASSGNLHQSSTSMQS